MTDSNTKGTSAASTKKVQAQSTIQFPYGDLNDGIAVASAIMKLGGVPCEPDQLAAALGQTPTSGSFRGKIHTARTFGIIETQQGRYTLTELGFALTDKVQERAARADAFLRVALYRRLYEEFRNRQLPPSNAALERTFVSYGVVQTQVERARQAFQRSAQQAGYFDHGNRDRLVRPPVGASTGSAPEVPTERADNESPREDPQSGGGNGSGGGSRPPGGLHPFIQGLLETLPEPGTLWSIEGRAAWLQAAAQNFMLIYKGDGKIEVSAQTSKGGSAH